MIFLLILNLHLIKIFIFLISQYIFLKHDFQFFGILLTWKVCHPLRCKVSLTSLFYSGPADRCCFFYSNIIIYPVRSWICFLRLIRSSLNSVLPRLWRRLLNHFIFHHRQLSLFTFPFPSLWFSFPEGYTILQSFNQTVVMKTGLRKLGQISVTFRISITDAIMWVHA